MKKTMTKKEKGKKTKVKDPVSPRKEIARLAAAFVDVEEEVESILREGSPLEDIEGAKAQAAEVLNQYSALMKRLGRNERKELQQILKPGIDHIKSRLIRLKEAPE